MGRLWASVIQGHLRHPSQALLVLVGLALSIAVVVAIDLTIASARGAFELSRQALTGQASHQLLRTGGFVDSAEHARLRLALDLRRAAPVLEGDAVVVAGGHRVQLLGVDPLAEASVRPWTAAAVGGATDAVLPALLGRDDAVLVPSALAGSLGLAEGDRLVLRHAGRDTGLAVVAVLPDGAVPDGARDRLLMDLPAAQAVLGRPRALSRVDLVLDTGEVGRLLEALGAHDGLELRATLEQDAALGAVSAAFETNLRALALLALLVGVFLVFQTLGFLALRRRAQIGLWRAIGVSRAELARLFLTEALVLGAVAGLLGIGLGVWVATQLLELVTRTYDDLFYRVAVGQVVLAPAVLLKAVALALGGAVVGALWPLRDALSVPPLANLGRLAQIRRTASRARRGLVPALAVFALAWLALWLGPDGLGFAFAAIFAMLAAALGLLPALALALLLLVERFAGRRLPVSGRLLVSGTRLGLDRTGIALAALSLAVATLIGMGTMIHSFRAGVTTWVERSLQADFYLTHGGGEGALPDGLAGAVERLPGVEALSLTRRRSVMGEDGPFAVVGVELPARGFDGYEVIHGEAGSVRDGLDAGGVLVSEPLANRLGLAPGDTLALPTPRGPQPLTVVGVHRDYSSPQGVATLARRHDLRLFEDPVVNAIGVYAAGDGLQRVEQGLRAVVRERDGITMVSAAEVRAQTMAVFQRTFAVTDLLRLLAGAIAVVAVLGALLALQLERLRELSLLRALGMPGPALARLQVWQALLLGGLSGLLAIPLGLMLATLLIRVVNLRSFGWSMPLVVPWTQVAIAVGLALLASLVAAALPARRVARMPLAARMREQPL